MRKFKIGQKVVCVEEFTVPRTRKEMKPVVGMIYTVRGLITEGGEHGIYLKEIINPIRQYRGGYREPAFGEGNFRLVPYPSAIKDIMSKLVITQDRADVQIGKDTNRNDKNK